MLFYRFFIKPLRIIIDPKYLLRPKGSDILTYYIRQRNYPSWTSYFIPYIYIQDDHFARKHFNFSVDGHNYHVLRVGAFPYIKYHCTKRPIENLTVEDNIYRIITISNLCVPCLLYGIAAIFLIRHTEFVKDNRTGAIIPIHFLIKIIFKMGPLATVDYSPTPQLILLYLFIALPLHYGIALVGIQIIKLIYKSYLLLMYPIFDFLFFDILFQSTKIYKNLQVHQINKKNKNIEKKKCIVNNSFKKPNNVENNDLSKNSINKEAIKAIDECLDDNDSVLTNNK